MTAPQTAAFSADDLLLLERTADALSAWWGKPVMAEHGQTEGVPWAVFGLPLAIQGDDDEDPESFAVWQMGGAGAQRLGNAGGLAPAPDDVHDCRLLWAIQVGTEPGERYVRLDGTGQVEAWSDDLGELLPFQVDADESAGVDGFPEDDEDDEDAAMAFLRDAQAKDATPPHDHSHHHDHSHDHGTCGGHDHDHGHDAPGNGSHSVRGGSRTRH
ncbi:hypothetical protein [Verticiella alkaliphila]|uniref:hypothetical protein n=1 Tax=Verticiella alkaliphila TaxID=2779529 RepID=UPI001C0DE5B0|nr:hypothetical protein [Verticiella sp. GG226]